MRNDITFFSNISFIITTFRRYFGKKTLITSLLLGCITIFHVHTASAELIENDAKVQTTKVSTLHWMKSLDDTLPLNQITIPGTHESGATRCPITDMAKCQFGNINDQLQAGIRFFDIRVILKNDDFHIYHGIVNQRISFIDIIRDLYIFLDRNPSEFVFLKLKQEDSSKKKDGIKFNRMFSRYEVDFPNLFYTHASPQTHLGEVRGKIVIISDTPKLNFTNPLDWKNAQLFNKQGEWQNIMGDISKKWSLIEAQLVKAKNALKNNNSPFYVNAMNASGVVNLAYPPKYFSDKLNPMLAKYLEENPQGPYGIVTMDFVISENGEQAVKQLIQVNFPEKTQ